MNCHLFKPQSSASGGGGGGSIVFEESANAPIKDVDATTGLGIYSFEASLGQSLYTALRVPSSFSAGTQILLNILVYSADTSGDILIQSVATLIRPETDQITSTTNQRTSTNSAVTLSSGTQNEPQAISLDLTDSSGNINSVQVTAGDIILVQITRDNGGTDTATGDLEFIIQSAEGVFS